MRMLTCKVCGKKYDACKTPKIAEGYFQWNDIACSPKCAAEYLTNLNQPKAEEEDPTPKAQNTTSKKTKKSASAEKTQEQEKVETQPD